MIMNYTNFNALDKRIDSTVTTNGKATFMELQRKLSVTKGRLYARLLILAACNVIDIEYTHNNNVIIITPGTAKIKEA
jgi:hypothetical protein